MLATGHGWQSIYPLAPLAADLGGNWLAGKAVTNPLVAKVASAPGPRNVPNPLLTGVVIGGEQQQRRNALDRP